MPGTSDENTDCVDEYDASKCNEMVNLWKLKCRYEIDFNDGSGRAPLREKCAATCGTCFESAPQEGQGLEPPQGELQQRKCSHLNVELTFLSLLR